MTNDDANNILSVLDDLRYKRNQIEKKPAYLCFLGLILALIPGLNIVGVIILAYCLEDVRKNSLLYGYYAGKEDTLLNAKHNFEKIKTGRLI